MGFNGKGLGKHNQSMKSLDVVNSKPQHDGLGYYGGNITKGECSNIAPSNVQDSRIIFARTQDGGSPTTPSKAQIMKNDRHAYVTSKKSDKEVSHAPICIFQKWRD